MVELSGSSTEESEVDSSNRKIESSSIRDSRGSSFFFSPAYTGCKATTAARKISSSTKLNARGKAIQYQKAGRKRA